MNTGSDRLVMKYGYKRDRDMALNDRPLWIVLIKNLMKVDVIRMAGLTTNVMAQMGRDKPTIFKDFE